MTKHRSGDIPTFSSLFVRRFRTKEDRLCIVTGNSGGSHRHSEKLLGKTVRKIPGTSGKNESQRDRGIPGEKKRKMVAIFDAKFKDRKVWTVAVWTRVSLASARFQIRRSPGECTSIQIYRMHRAHTPSFHCDSGAFLKSKRCISTGASALSTSREAREPP